MRFVPKSEQEVQEFGLIKPAIYDFAVSAAAESVSSKGNDMTVVDLAVEDENGEVVIIRDYLVATDGMMYKIRHFAESIGMLADYERGELPVTKLRGKTGKAKIIIKPATTEFRAKNVVADYVTGASGASAQSKSTATTGSSDMDDEIPF